MKRCRKCASQILYLILIMIAFVWKKIGRLGLRLVRVRLHRHRLSDQPDTSPSRQDYQWQRVTGTPHINPGNALNISMQYLFESARQNCMIALLYDCMVA